MGYYGYDCPEKPNLGEWFKNFPVSVFIIAFGIILIVFSGFQWLFSLMGLGAVFMGCRFLIHSSRPFFTALYQKAETWWLKRFGRVVWAKVVKCVHDYQGPLGGEPDLHRLAKDERGPYFSYNVHRDMIGIDYYDSVHHNATNSSTDYPYHIVASFTDPDGYEHLYESTCSFDESAAFMKGDTVRVYVSRDYMKYYVDLDMRMSMFAD